VVVVVGFIGCCGAFKVEAFVHTKHSILCIQENRFAIFLYFVILLLAALAAMAGLAVGATKSVNDLRQPLLNSMKLYDSDSLSPTGLRVTKAWDKIQIEV